MKQEISELQKRRADNIIWSVAKDYSFAPDFKAYDSQGNVDIYWNVIYGCARSHFEYAKLEKLFAMLDKYRNAAYYQDIFWNALEPVLFKTELADRPVLERIRPEPVETELKFTVEMTTDEIVDEAKKFFYEKFGLYGDGKIRLKFLLPHMKRMSVDSFLQRGRNVIHEKNIYSDDVTVWSNNFQLKSNLSVSELREFIETKFGKSVYSPEQIIKLEKKLCTDNHKFTHLMFTNGEIVELKGVYNTFEMHQRKRQAERIANNRTYYASNLTQNKLQISRLSNEIMNSILMHMQPMDVKSNSGMINPSLVWRGAVLDDEKVFTRRANENAGEFSVDIFLDASHSQVTRTDKISSQAFIISEALARCRVPCRVTSFCSMSGFTVLKMFNDYSISSDNSRIFDYYAEGCSRDGLALRAINHLISQTSYEHKMLIILSDVKPLDVERIRKDEHDVGISYDGIQALNDTAHEVRKLRAAGVSVVCIFTGDDESLPSAKMVYGQDFVRIRDFTKFADMVGKLISNQIKSYSE